MTLLMYSETRSLYFAHYFEGDEFKFFDYIQQGEKRAGHVASKALRNVWEREFVLLARNEKYAQFVWLE